MPLDFQISYLDHFEFVVRKINSTDAIDTIE